MKYGFYGTYVDEAGETSIYIDQEVIEFARQNQIVQQRLDAEAERQRRAATEAKRLRRQSARQEFSRRMETRRLIRQELTLLAVSVAATAAGWLGLLALWLGSIISVSCLGAACYKAGRWIRGWRK